MGFLGLFPLFFDFVEFRLGGLLGESDDSVRSHLLTRIGVGSVWAVVGNEVVQDSDIVRRDNPQLSMSGSNGAEVQTQVSTSLEVMGG